MCSPVCNAFSGVHDLLGSVISVFSSVSNKVSLVAHAHLTSAAGWGSSVDFSISRYGYIKTQFTSCLTLASDCIQKVAQMVYRDKIERAMSQGVIFSFDSRFTVQAESMWTVGCNSA